METILKRPDGSKVKIVVRSASYDLTVYKCEAGKRTWIEVPETINNYQYRNLPSDRNVRQQWVLQKQLEVVTPQEIYEAKIKLWESLKPTL